MPVLQATGEAGGMRTRLPTRRPNITARVSHNNETYLITFGFDGEDQIREVFCADPRVGSDIHALLTDACIIISIALQNNIEAEVIAKSLGENRSEGAASGPPASLIGAIARSILEMQAFANKIEPSVPKERNDLG